MQCEKVEILLVGVVEKSEGVTTSKENKGEGHLLISKWLAVRKKRWERGCLGRREEEEKEREKGSGRNLGRMHCAWGYL